MGLAKSYVLWQTNSVDVAGLFENMDETESLGEEKDGREKLSHKG